MNKVIANEIIDILRGYIEVPKSELNFNNNFELLIAVSLSAQTTDKRVNMITPILFSKYPNPNLLMNARYDDVLDIIKSLGLAQNKAKNIIGISRMLVDDFNGEVPSEISDLTKLPGVGRKTALVVRAVGFNIPAFPVDTHLIRMANRLGFLKSDDPIKIEKAYMKYIKEEDWIDSHHLLLLFGRYTCKSIAPLCSDCRLKKYCKFFSKKKA